MNSHNPRSPVPGFHSPASCFRWLYPFDYPLLVYLGATIWIAKRYNLRIEWAQLYDFRYDGRILLLGLLPTITVIFAWRVLADGQNLTEMWSEMRTFASQHLVGWTRWYEILRTMLALKLCFLCYSHLKQSIPLLNDILYDSELRNADVWIHCGISPEAVAARVAAIPGVMVFFDKMYFFWYLLMAPFFVVFLLHPSTSRRWHYFTTYFLLWMVGGTLAIILPSLGPVFCTPEIYATFDMPIARGLQESLWTHYCELLLHPEDYRVCIYEGIAAFPSLHVGVAVLYALFMREHKGIWTACVAYAIVIQCGSVLLGWHYAVDGYACALLAIGLYYLVQSVLCHPEDAPGLAGSSNGISEVDSV